MSGTSRIQNKFLELDSKNEKALIAYTMVWYPNEKDTLTVIR
jgi:tryptophan synthase alpha subunit